MSVVPVRPSSGAIPRYVWVLLSVVLIVLGFGVGGAIRAALPYAQAAVHEPTDPAAAAAPPPAGAPLVLPAPAGSNLPAASASASTSSSAAPSAPAASAPAAVPLSASHRGKPVPARSGTGRRIVYQESTMHLWVVQADGTVIRDYPVTGRPDWPKPGRYKVLSKSVATISPRYGVTFDWMVRFAHGRKLMIGFHDIPRVIGSGKPIQAEEQLGAPVGHGGCVRQRTVDAKWLYSWATLGTPVVVLR